MPPEKDKPLRLPIFGPLNIKDINDYLSISKTKFNVSYNAPCPYKVDRNIFEILCVLGQGSFGKVLLVRDPNKYLYAMKALKKRGIVKKKQIDHTLNEKRILQSLDCPFVVRMEFFSKDNSYIYFIMPFVSGGDLFTQLQKFKKFSEDLARFYTAQVVLGLEYLHNLSLIYRDIKPENILIDHCGYLKITDFGFAKVVLSRTYSVCGTPQFFAPEMISGLGYGRSVDWWALGVLLFEMNSGQEPFHSSNTMAMFAKILKQHYRLPISFSPELKDLVAKLLTTDVTRRYGNLKGGAQDVKDHAWFSSVNWLAMLNRKVKAPFLPETRALANFPLMWKSAELKISNVEEYKDEFKDF